VFAIEQGPVARLARRIVAVNGFDDRVTVIEDNSHDVELPEPADVLITETIGNAGLEEGIVAWVDDARARFLKPDATVIPSLVSVEAALVEVSHDYAQIDRWAEPLMGLDFTPLREVTVNNMLWGEFSPANLLSSSEPILRADLAAGSYQGKTSRRMAARRDGVAHGIGVWFDAQLYGELHISNRPPTEVPSWQQGFLPLTTPLALGAGEEVEVSLEVADSGSDWIWQVGSDTAAMSTMHGRLDGSSAV
jgi:protein arginine N-methyltransferase 1